MQRRDGGVTPEDASQSPNTVIDILVSHHVEPGISLFQEMVLREDDIGHHGHFIEVGSEGHSEGHLLECLDKNLPVTAASYGVGTAIEHRLE